MDTLKLATSDCCTISNRYAPAGVYHGPECIQGTIFIGHRQNRFTSLGSLEVVKGDLIVDADNLLDLGSLREVLCNGKSKGKVSIHGLGICSLGNLKNISGNLDIRSAEKLTDLSSVEFIGGDFLANSACTRKADLGLSNLKNVKDIVFPSEFFEGFPALPRALTFSSLSSYPGGGHKNEHSLSYEDYHKLISAVESMPLTELVKWRAVSKEPIKSLAGLRLKGLLCKH